MSFKSVRKEILVLLPGPRRTFRESALSRPWLVSRGPLAGINLAYDGTPLLAGLGRAVEPEPMP